VACASVAPCQNPKTKKSGTLVLKQLVQTGSQKETLAPSCFLCFTRPGKNKAIRFTGGSFLNYARSISPISLSWLGQQPASTTQLLNDGTPTYFKILK